MKKFFTFVALAAASLSAMATDFIDTLEVSINGIAVTQTAQISVDKQENGKYNLQLNNFMLKSGADVVAVGNINLTDVEGTASATGDLTTLTFSGNINISNGNDPNVSFWMGPYLGAVPVNMTGELRGDKFYTVINIDMSSMLGQVIKVTFGNGGYQIANSGFEYFHTATATNGSSTATSDEPNVWHSFQSATNDGLSMMLAWFAISVEHTFASDVVRPGSSGTKSVLVTSSPVFGSIIANGTITTGRINAGSASAADTKNHSFTNMDVEAADANGDPFYTQLYGLPDSLAVWVKFKQAIPQADHPYATISAAITDGTYYQDPEDKTYDNVIARAKNNTIESKDFAWQRISIPFTYEKDDETVLNGRKALHVTISTNADAGCGSTDSLYIDDIKLIYGCELSQVEVLGQPIELTDGVYEYSTSYKGTSELTPDDIKVVSASRGCHIVKSVELLDNATGGAVEITVLSADLNEKRTYRFYLHLDTDGIDSVENTANGKVEGVYNINGQRIDNAKAGQVVITKHANGKVVKSLKK